MPRSVGILAAVIALGCATARPPAEAAAQPAEAVAEDAVSTDAAIGEAAAVAPSAEGEDEYRTFRIGFWELDLLALDFEPRGTTFRLLDFRILRLLEIGSGPEYHSFSLVELPVLLNLFTTRRDGIEREVRVVDIQAVATAAARHLREAEDVYETHVFKLPVIGSFFSRQRDDGTEHQSYLFLFRREVDR